MRIYVAGASLEMEFRAKPIIKKLKELGHEITYDWTKNVDDFNKNELKESTEECALNDYHGVTSADILVLLSPQGPSTGAWVEFGLAIATRKRIFISGDVRKCIFAELPFRITKFENDELLIFHFSYANNKELMMG